MLSLDRGLPNTFKSPQNVSLEKLINESVLRFLVGLVVEPFGRLVKTSKILAFVASAQPSSVSI